MRHEELIKNIRRTINNLGDNWNGYGAVPISNNVIADCIKFISSVDKDFVNIKYSPSADNEIVVELFNDKNNNDIVIMSFYGDSLFHVFIRINKKRYYFDDIDIDTWTDNKELKTKLNKFLLM